MDGQIDQQTDVLINDQINSVCIFLGLLAGKWECPSVYIKEEEKDSLNKMNSYTREKLTEHHIICDQLAFEESVNNHCIVMTIYSDYNKCVFLIARAHSLARRKECATADLTQYPGEQ